MRSAVKPLTLFVLFIFSVFLLPSLGFAQYVRTDLVSNTGTAQNPADPDLINGWGLVSTATSPFWVSDNGTGKSTLYAISNPPQGLTATKQGLIVTIPSAAPGAQGTPTGIVSNESAGTSAILQSQIPSLINRAEPFSFSRHWMERSAVGTRGLAPAVTLPRSRLTDLAPVLPIRVWPLPATVARISYMPQMTVQIVG